MKPDWADAPEWANWLAIDFSQRWYWYEHKPCENRFDRWITGTGRFESCVPFEKISWSQTLEQRP